MSNISASFGYECPRDGSRVLLSLGSGIPKCPSCGAQMVPATGPNAPESMANYTCSKCNSRFLLMLEAGPITECPQCGHPIP